MKINYFILLALAIVIGCKEKESKEREILSLDDSNHIAEELYKVPPSSDFETLRSIYIVDEDNKIHEIRYSYLKNLYHQSYIKSYKSLRVFIYDVVNQNIKLRKIDFLHASNDFSCILDKNISEVYYNKKIDGLIEQYCIIKSPNRIILKKELTSCEHVTLCYYFFLNNYYLVSDDYLGIDTFNHFDEFHK